MTAGRVGVVLNPVARRAGPALARLGAACRERGQEIIDVLTTTVAEPGGPQAARLLAAGADRVVVLGGDGTVREVAEVLAGSGATLGIVPLGTANLVARNLGLSLGDGPAPVATALGGEIRDVDVGRVAYEQLGPAGTVRSPERVFLVVVGLGYDGEAVARTGPRLKRVAGWTSYIVVGARHLASRGHRLTLQVDGGAPRELRAWTVLVGVAGRIPLGIDLFPEAAPDDGRLHVMTVTPGTPLHWVPIALKGILHRPGSVPGLGYEAATRARVAAGAPLTAQLDGDPHPDVLALDVRVEPGALRVAAPRPRS